MRLSLAYSFLFHCLGLIVLFIFSDFSPHTPIEAKKIEIEAISQQDFEKRLRQALSSKEAQIVQTDKSLVSDKAPNSSEKMYLSSHNQRVDQNTRAAKIGAFKNVLKEGSPKGESKISKLFKLQDTPNEDIKSAEKATPSGRLRNPASTPEGEGQSATDDYLEDVAIGAQTILNANEYRFYGFYNRIREQLIHHWHQRLKIEIQTLQNQGRSIANTTRRTQVRVFLNASGNIQHTQLLGSSGIDRLDRAATDAFKLASPFAHPPKEMINEEGLVPIRWEFVVVSSQDSGVQFRVERTGFR